MLTQIEAVAASLRVGMSSESCIKAFSTFDKIDTTEELVAATKSNIDLIASSWKSSFSSSHRRLQLRFRRLNALVSSVRTYDSLVRPSLSMGSDVMNRGVRLPHD